MYLAAGREATTLCTCYGDVDVWNRRNGERRRIISGYHTPMMANAGGLTGHMPMKKGMDMGHSDDELAMLEKLVGRVSPIELRQRQLQEAAEQA